MTTINHTAPKPRRGTPPPLVCPPWCVRTKEDHQREAANPRLSFYMHESANLCEAVPTLASFTVKSQSVISFDTEPFTEHTVAIEGELDGDFTAEEVRALISVLGVALTFDLDECAEVPADRKPVEPEFGSIEDVATYLGVNPKTVRRRLSDKTLTRHRFGRCIRIRWSEVYALMSKPSY